MSQHHNDLVRRLRNAAPPAIEGPNLLDEAADRIAALEAERTEHAGLMIEATRQIDGFNEEVPKLLARIAQLEAAGNDLRASLVGMCHINNVMPDSVADRVKRFDALFELPQSETPADPGISHDGCRYLAPTGGVCNKCGFVDNSSMNTAKTKGEQT